MNEVVKQLDALLERLDRGVSDERSNDERGPDAIDAILARPARETGVRRLHDDPAIMAFRRELVDGLVRIDTLRKFLDVLSSLVGGAWPSK